MYTLYSDKLNNFEAQIELEGASYNKTECRLVLESNNGNLIYYGNVNSTGKVEIPIDKGLNEIKKGSAKLEVIAESTYFIPWEDKFEVEASKKVMAEVKSPTKSPQLNDVKVGVKVVQENVVENFDSFLRKKKITQRVLSSKSNIKNVGKLIEGYIRLNKLNDDNIFKLYNSIGEIVTNLPTE